MRADDAWQVQRRWSAAANRAGASIERWRVVNLALLVLGSVLGALATQDQWFPDSITTALGLAGAAALALAGFVQTRILTADKVRAHVVARATSEALKGLVHHYLAAVPPFTGADRDGALLTKFGEVDERVRGQAGLIVGVRSDGKSLPAVQGIVDYVRVRAERQRDWHAATAVTRKRLANRWRAAELAATAVAAVMAAAGGVLDGEDLSTWVAVATTAGAAFAAHLAAKQHVAIADSYATTSADLDALVRGFDAESATPDQAAAFVAKVESVLAAQNNGWVGLFAGK
jgi:hypothetical protein